MYADSSSSIRRTTFYKRVNTSLNYCKNLLVIEPMILCLWWQTGKLPGMFGRHSLCWPFWAGVAKAASGWGTLLFVITFSKRAGRSQRDKLGQKKWNNHRPGTGAMMFAVWWKRVLLDNNICLPANSWVQLHCTIIRYCMPAHRGSVV